MYRVYIRQIEYKDIKISYKILNNKTKELKCELKEKGIVILSNDKLKIIYTALNIIIKT